MSLRHEVRDLMLGGAPDGVRLPFLVNDMVIEEQLCQMRCSYCLTEEFNLLMNVPDAQQRLTTDKRADWHEVLARFHAEVDAPVLRVSGGEFFWLRASTEFVEECARLYETVQIITNGVFLTPARLDAIAATGNAQLNVSLDGHTLQMNRHRFPGGRQDKLFPLILRNLAGAVERGIPVEIQSVLTDANVAHQHEFARYLREQFDDRVTLYFFPVRGNETDAMVPTREDHLAPVLREWDELHPVLPPRPYVEHMARQVRDGRRTLPCLVTAAMVQLFGQGDVSACPHAWIEPMGNLAENPALVRDSLGTHQHYNLFLQPRPRFSFCTGCATPSDVLNLYLLGQVSLPEIQALPLYRGARTGERLRDLRERLAPVSAQMAPAEV